MDDATKVGGFYITLPQECRAETGAELFYLYGWNGDASWRSATEDENPMTDSTLSTLYEDSFGYSNADDLKNTLYSYVGSEGDAELQIMDGCPAIVRKNGDGGTATLKVDPPSDRQLKGQNLSGKVKVNMTYEIPTDKKFYMYTLAGPIQILESCLNPPMTSMLVGIKGSTDRSFKSSQIFGGKRTMEIDYDFDNKTYQADINGIRQGTGFRQTTSTEFTGMEVQHRGGGNGETGAYIKISEYKISKELPVYSLLTNTAEYMDMSQITTDWDCLTGDIALPNQFENLDLSWHSMDQSVISDTGSVQRGQYDDKSTVLIATYHYQGSKINRAIPVTVKAQQSNRLFFTKDDISAWSISGKAESAGMGFAFCEGSAELTIPDKGFFAFGYRPKLENSVTFGTGGDAVISCYSDTDCIGTVTASALSLADGKPHKLRFELDAGQQKLTLFDDTAEIWSTDTTSCVLQKLRIETQTRCVVENTAAWIDNEDVPRSVLDSLSWTMLSDAAQNLVRENLTLPETPTAEVEVSFISRNGAIDDFGVVTRGAESITGEVIIRAALKESPDVFAEKIFNVTVLKKNMENYLNNSEITSTTRPAHGSFLENLADDNPETAFETNGSETEVMISVDIKEVKTIGSVEIDEDSGTVTNVKIETSQDNTAWSTVYDGDRASLAPMLSKGRYIKITLTKEKGELRLYEMIITGDYTGEQAVNSDWALLQLPVGNTLNTSFTLPKQGKWGSRIETTSSNRTIAVTQGTDSYTIVPVPQSVSEVGSLRINLTKDGTEKTVNVSYTVSGTRDSGSGSGSGNGVGRTGSSTGGVYRAQTEGNAEMISDISANSDDGQTVFEDVSNTYWAKEYIEGLYKFGIISGTGDRIFSPEKPVTREEFVKMLMLALDYDRETQVNLGFKDVSNNDWFYPYVEQAVAKGIVKGVSEDTFGAGLPITREDLAVMVYRALADRDYKLNSTSSAISDAAEIADYAVNAVNALCETGVIQGDENGKFAPKDTATRAETAKIVYFILKLA